MALKIESLIHRLKSAYVSKKKIYEFIFPEDTMFKKDFEGKTQSTIPHV